MKAKHALSALAILILAIACHRDDDDPETPAAPVDGREKFVGYYNVYDLTGHFLYTMSISKLNDVGKDSLYVQNWGDQFNFYVRHEDGDQTNFLNMIPPFPSVDHEGHRWAFFQHSDPHFGTEQIVNDTLRMSYSLDNIAFYVQDGVTYQSMIVQEYGIKQ